MHPSCRGRSLVLSCGARDVVPFFRLFSRMPSRNIRSRHPVHRGHTSGTRPAESLRLLPMMETRGLAMAMRLVCEKEA